MCSSDLGGTFSDAGTVSVTGVLTPLGTVNVDSLGSLFLNGGEIFGGTLAGSGERPESALPRRRGASR